MFASNTLSFPTGKYFVFPIISCISIFIFLGTNNKPNEAINISFKCIIATVFPFEIYVYIIFPIKKPTITPILPNLFNSPAIMPDNAKHANSIGSPSAIIPNTTPIVIPAVPPTNIPFFQPNINTSNIHNIFLIEKPKIDKFPNAQKAIDSNKLAPITSSTVKTFFKPASFITIIEFTNIL